MAYCTHSDVGLLLETTFTESTKPTSTQVTAMITDQEAYIDAETHHSWKETTVTNEHHDARWGVLSRGFWGMELMFKLNHRAIRSIDKLEWWDGAQWEDLKTTGTEGRNDDYWADYVVGQVFIRSRFPITMVKTLRVSYKYGESTVPGDIKLACAKLVAKEVARAENRVEILTEGSAHFSWSERVESWDKEIQRTIARRREMTTGMM